MEEGSYVVNKKPAGSDPLIIDLYSQQHMEPNAKSHLSKQLTQTIDKSKPVSVLILGARCGLTAQLLIPFCHDLVLVEEQPYADLLEARFVKGKKVDYYFGKEGFLGSKQTVATPTQGNTKVKVVPSSSFVDYPHPYYDIVILQNTIITPELNLVSQLFKIKHGLLITTLVPGYIINKPFFPFIVRLQKDVLRQFYDNIFQEKVQSKRFITGRRNEIYYMEVFGWKKQNISEDKEILIREVLKEGEKELSGIWKFQKEQESKASNQNPYETQLMVQSYLNFHYGDDNFGVENFPAQCAKLCISKAKELNITGRALDLGCAVGRTSIDLAQYFQEVIGLDFSGAFVRAAQEAVANNYEQISHKIKFVQGDACNLKPELGKFSLIFGGNLIDRLPNPAAFLRSVGNFLQKKGVLILTSPYSWLEEYTPKELWVGGYIQNGKEVTTNEGLKKILTAEGFKELCPCEDLLFSIKDNDWVFQYTYAWVTFWIKQ